MPQLKSGRHVAVSASPYLDALAADKDESRYFAIVALRLHAGTPQALRDHLVIGYFGEDQGTPPDAPSYNSGYCVSDVLEGRSDWNPHCQLVPNSCTWLEPSGWVTVVTLRPASSSVITAGNGHRSTPTK